MGSQQLIEWLNKDIDNKLVSEHILGINEKIIIYLKQNNIPFDGDQKVFLMKLILFLYKNSSV